MRSTVQLQSAATPQVEWEECACPSCGGWEQRPILESADTYTGLRFLVVQCVRCSLCFTNPRPDATSILRFYSPDYSCHQIKDRSSRHNAIAAHLVPGGSSRLLDFGCGGGAFLRDMATKGWRVTGLDVNESAIAAVRASGISAVVGSLPDVHWPDHCFEAITLRQSLEHTHDPLAVLSSAHRMLTVGGKLIVTVPNFEGQGSRWFESFWYGLDLPRHLTHFTPVTLCRMLVQAGFAQIDLFQEAHNSWTRHSAELALRAGHGGLMVRMMRTHMGSRIAATWGNWLGRAEGILAVAIK